MSFQCCRWSDPNDRQAVSAVQKAPDFIFTVDRTAANKGVSTTLPLDALERQQFRDEVGRAVSEARLRAPMP